MKCSRCKKVLETITDLGCHTLRENATLCKECANEFRALTNRHDQERSDFLAGVK